MLEGKGRGEADVRLPTECAGRLLHGHRGPVPAAALVPGTRATHGTAASLQREKQSLVTNYFLGWLPWLSLLPSNKAKTQEGLLPPERILLSRAICPPACTQRAHWLCKSNTWTWVSEKKTPIPQKCTHRPLVYEGACDTEVRRPFL